MPFVRAALTKHKRGQPTGRREHFDKFRSRPRGEYLSNCCKAGGAWLADADYYRKAGIAKKEIRFLKKTVDVCPLGCLHRKFAREEKVCKKRKCVSDIDEGRDAYKNGELEDGVADAREAIAETAE